MAIDGEALPNWEEAQYHMVLRPDRDLGVGVRRDGGASRLEVRSASTDEDKIGTIGVHPLVRVGEVVKGSPAQEAGLQVDDAILQIDDKPVREFAEIPALVKGAAGRTSEGRALARRRASGRRGRSPRRRGRPAHRHRPQDRPQEVRRPSDRSSKRPRCTWQITKQTFDVLGRLLTAQISPKTMMGPLGIAKASGDARGRGGRRSSSWSPSSASRWGSLNLFPLAPLDGGHLAILLGEGLLRRDFSMTVKAWIMNAGAAVIFLLMARALLGPQQDEPGEIPTLAETRNRSRRGSAHADSRPVVRAEGDEAKATSRRPGLSPDRTKGRIHLEGLGEQLLRLLLVGMRRRVRSAIL